MYARISTLYPGNSIFYTAKKVMGNLFGNIFIILFSLYSFYLGAMSMGIFAGFNQVVSMPETSRMLTFIIFGGACLYVLKKGIGTLGGFVNIAAASIVFLIILINILSLNQWQPYYLAPVFQIKPSTFLGDVFLTGVFPLGEAVILCTLFGFTEKSVKKPLLWGLFAGGFLLVAEILRSIAVLGPGTISLLYYPSYTATGVINIADFFSRVEVIISVSFYVAQIIKVCICTRYSYNITESFTIC
jgi:spore germination protein KB